MTIELEIRGIFGKKQEELCPGTIISYDDYRNKPLIPDQVRLKVLADDRVIESRTSVINTLRGAELFGLPVVTICDPAFVKITIYEKEEIALKLPSDKLGRSCMLRWRK